MLFRSPLALLAQSPGEQRPTEKGSRPPVSSGCSMPVAVLSPEPESWPRPGHSRDSAAAWVPSRPPCVSPSP